MQTWRVALVGCGAVVKNFYLPVISRRKDFAITWLADLDLDGMQRLASQYKLRAQLTTDYHSISENVDYAIIALPHFLHLDAITHFYQHNIHVICEKPLTMSYAESRVALDFARQGTWRLHPAFVRNFFVHNILINDLITSKQYGEIRAVEISEGFKYDWPATSDSFYERTKSGGGVLIDTGSHVLATLLFFSRGSPSFEVDYRDDAAGGIEAECELSIRFADFPAFIELSRLGPLKNRIRIEFAEAELYSPIFSANQILIKEKPANVASLRLVNPKPLSYYFAEMLSHFCQLEPDSKTYWDELELAAEVTRITDLCYSYPQPLRKSWETFL